jgi:hypothetical protein
LRPADGFAELAVADDVDADGGLPAHDLGNRVAQTFGVGSLIERLAGLLGAQEFAQPRRADKAAHMGGEDSVVAAFHLSPPRWRSRNGS